MKNQFDGGAGNERAEEGRDEPGAEGLVLLPRAPTLSRNWRWQWRKNFDGRTGITVSSGTDPDARGIPDKADGIDGGQAKVVKCVGCQAQDAELEVAKPQRYRDGSASR